MIKIYKIDVVHPVFKRIIKTNLTAEQLSEFCTELLDAGYEEDNFDIEITKRIYEEGDTNHKKGKYHELRKIRK